MIELTTEQQKALASAEEPLTVVDPSTHQSYVLIRHEMFTRLRGILDDDDVRLMEHLIADTDPEDWEDASNYDQGTS